MRCLHKTSNQFTTTLRFLLLGILAMSTTFVAAEGIRQVAPNATDAPVMLETGRPDFGNFASPNGDDNSRLFITIGNADEIVYLGLSGEYNDDGEAFNTNNSQYVFQIRRALGNGNADPIVHGPFAVDRNNANLTDWANAVWGNYPTTATNGSGELIYVFNPSEPGNYYIEFFESSTAPDRFGDPEVNIGVWDITVTRNGSAIDGRIWSRNWAFRTPQVDGTTPPACVWDRVFNGQLYSYTTDGFVSRIDFAGAGLQGLSFNIAFNSQGPGQTNDLRVNRQSIAGVNSTDNTAEHKIFLNEPDPELFPDGVCGEVNPASTFRCNGADDFCLDVSVTKPGQVEIIIDFDRNGQLDDNSQDVSLIYEFLDDDLNACIPWDGLRGDGQPIDFGDTVDLIVVYSQGIQHWSVYDLEYLTNGFCVETIRPQCSPDLSSTLLYWDDRNIIEDSGTGAVKDQRSGCECTTGCRSWNNFDLGDGDGCSNFDDNATSGYGDKSTINTWWFANNSTVIRANIPLVQATIEGPDQICNGETTTFTATDSGATPPVIYNWAGPGVNGATTASVIVSQNGEYCVTITDDLGCSSSTCKNLTVLDAGTSDIDYPTEISACPGDIVMLMPTGDITGHTFSWSPANLVDDPNSPSPSLTFTTPVTLTVTITSPQGCVITRTVNLVSNTVPEADFTFDSGCASELTIDFTNQSTNGVSYMWDFGDPNTTDDISTDISPSYTYDAPGTYLVTLTTTSADGCIKGTTQEIEVIRRELTADFDIIYNECTDNGSEVQFINTSINGYGGNLTYAWTFTGRPGSNQENPVLNFLSSQSITVILTIITENNCVASTTRVVDIEVGPRQDQFPPTLIVCEGVPTAITPGGDPGFTYTWSPTTGIDLTDPARPIFSPATSTTYSVTVSNGVAACDIVETVEVTVPPTIGLSVSGGGVVCTPTTTLQATTQEAATIQWLDPLTMSVLASGNSYTVDVSGSTDYLVIATDGSGCVEQTTVNVSGGPVDFSVPDTVAVCFGEEILVSVTNEDPNDILTYAWTPAELFEAGTEDDAMPNYIETIGTEDVMVTVTNQFGCDGQADVHIAVINPNISLSFTSLVDCNGTTVTFTNTSTNAFGYVWDFGDGSAPNFEENPVYTYAAPGTYQVTLSIIYDVSCRMPFTQEVEVAEPQIDAAFTYNISDCSGEQATIDFFDQTTNTLNNTTAWNWTFNTATPNTSNDQNPSVTVDGSGPLEVTLSIETANGCTSTITEILDIQLVDLDIALQDTIVICPGGSTVLNQDGNDSYTYSWTPIIGLDDPTATSPTAMPSVTTTYIATAYNTVGADTCFVMDSVVLFVPPMIDLMLDQDPVVTTCGEDVEITASANVEVDIVWTNSTGTIGTGPTITLNPFRTDTITATATDEFGCMDSEQIIINDNGVDIEVEPGDDEVSACVGVPSTLTVINLDEEDTLTYVWSPADLINGPTDQASAEILVDAPGTYEISVTVTNQNDCTEDIIFTVNALDFNGMVPDTVFVCHETATPLNPDGNTTYTYNWDPGTGLSSTTVANPTATLANDQRYYVTITDPATMCSNVDSTLVIVYPDINLMAMGDTVLCDMTPAPLSATTDIPVDLEWTLDGTPIGNTPDITFTPQMEGTFVITVTATDPNTGCVETATVTVTFDPLENVIPDSSVRVCPGESTAINPNGNPDLTYMWAPLDDAIDISNPWNPVVTTTIDRTYSVTVVDEMRNCRIVAEVIVEVEDAVGLDAEPEQTTTCGENVTLTATTAVDATITWTLLPDNSTLGSGTELTFMPPLGSSQVVATAVSTAGCTERDTVMIDNYPIDATINAPIIICEPTATTELTVTNQADDQTLTIEWNPEGVITDPPTGATVTVDPNITDTFTATVTNQFGCTETLTTTVTVIDLMGDLSISADPVDILLGESTTITVSGCDDCTYEWFPPNGETVDGEGPVVTTTPNSDGDLVYEVTVSKDGCEETLSITISVLNAICDTDHLFFPNAFTPNNDGDNDVLRLRSNFLDELLEIEWFVYNRWGEEMYRTQDPQGAWDGTYRGEELAPDVYGYWLRVVCPNEEEFIQKGNVSILR